MRNLQGRCETSGPSTPVIVHRCYRDVTIALIIVTLSVVIFSTAPSIAQNVVDDGSGTIPVGDIDQPVRLSNRQVTEIIYREPMAGRIASSRDAMRVAAKLDSHVLDLVAGYPLRPFHHTLGISGQEVYFDHPDRLFLSLSLALPYLRPATAARVKRFMHDRLADSTPYGMEGFDRRSGTVRENYDVPEEVRFSGRGRAAGVLGVYAFWFYCRIEGGLSTARRHWHAVRERIDPLLTNDVPFDPLRLDDPNNEAQALNANIAGCIGAVHLARLVGDRGTADRATERIRRLLEIRIHLEQVNTHIVSPTLTTTKHLHAYKLPRYCDLTLPVGDAVRRHVPSAAPRLKSFRQARNGWWMAFGDRMIGGENYTNPPHFAHSVFLGAASIEALDSASLLSFIDIPWCRGDLFFIEKCAIALWVAGGRRWSKAPSIPVPRVDSGDGGN